MNAIRLSEADRIYFDRDDRARRGLRAKALMLGIALYVPYCFFDILAFPDHTTTFLGIRLAAVAGMTLACLWFVRAPTRPWREVATLLYGACAVGGMFALSIVSPDAAVYFHFGAAVSVLYGGATFYVRPALVLLICLGIVPIYVLSLLLSAQNVYLAMIDASLMTTAFVTVAASNIYRYGLERRQYENEQALIRAREKAEGALAAALQADRAKDNLLAGVSHELRTPMNAIIGFSDAIRSEIFGPVKPDAYRDYIGHIHDSGLILKRNINDLLDLSSLSLGTTPLQETRFELRDMAANAVRICTFSARDARIDLRLAGKDREVAVHADRERLEQAVINLVTNAIKFSPPGSAVTVEVHPPTQAGVVVSVRDDGCGISGTALERITAPFAQEHADNLKRGSGGLGIGLAIVTRIMASMGGTIAIDSAEGEGTTVNLRLPRERIVAEITQGAKRAETGRRSRERLEAG